MDKIKKSHKNSLFVFLSFWVGVSFLYLLGFSNRLYYRISDFYIVFFVLIFFSLGWFISKIFWKKEKNIYLSDFSLYLAKKNRIMLLWFCLIALSIIEVAYSGFIPFLSILQGKSISHFAFGIPTVHGLVLAGFLFFSVIFSVFYLLTGEKKYIFLFLLIVIYSVLVMSRKIMMVAFFQFISVFFILKRVSLMKIIKVIIISLLVLVFFGYLGGVRSGNEVLSEYGDFNSSLFIDISGFGWGYLYLTTPVHNLIYTANHFVGEGSAFLPKTFEPLIPSAISSFFSSESIDSANRFLSAAEKRYWLESSVFNVSSAFVEPYVDNGYAGVGIFSFIIGFLSGISFGRVINGANWVVVNTIFMAAAALSIYSNNYSNLNFVGQFLWLLLFNIWLRLKINKGV